MRFGCSNHDLRVEVDVQNPRKDKRSFADAPSNGREELAAGYASLDRAETGEYAAKERRGLARDALYPKRY